MPGATTSVVDDRACAPRLAPPLRTSPRAIAQDGALARVASTVLVLVLHALAYAWLRAPMIYVRPSSQVTELVLIELTSEDGLPEPAMPEPLARLAKVPARAEPMRESEAKPPPQTPAQEILSPSAASSEESPVPAPPTSAHPAAAASVAVAEKPPKSASAETDRAQRNAMEQWQMRVLEHLQRHRRYPAQAQRRRQEGVAELRFSLDRHGRLLHVALEQGSGFEMLDAEALAVAARAQPFPPPPAAFGDNPIEVVVPVQFALRRH